jgi:succinyl-CoA synthetase beta subunit
LKIHEYQAKDLLAARGISVPAGEVGHQRDRGRRAPCGPRRGQRRAVVVVKSQIHAGGRGKGRFVEHPDLGGVQVVLDGLGATSRPRGAVAELADLMLGSTLVTVQTGPRASRCSGSTSSRASTSSASSTCRSSSTGRWAATWSWPPPRAAPRSRRSPPHTPEKILREVVDPAVGLTGFQARRLAFALGLQGDAFAHGVAFLTALERAAVELDADMVEVNPLVVTRTGEVMALDAKVSIDQNALYRHNDVMSLRDLSEEDPPRSRRRATASPSSSSTARSAAWSTAPAWRCRRWTSSSTRADRPPTSSTWAAAPPPRT